MNNKRVHRTLFMTAFAHDDIRLQKSRLLIQLPRRFVMSEHMERNLADTQVFGFVLQPCERLFCIAFAAERRMKKS